jgi:hypothetical protein
VQNFRSKRAKYKRLLREVGRAWIAEKHTTGFSLENAKPAVFHRGSHRTLQPVKEHTSHSVLITRQVSSLVEPFVYTGRT